MGIDISTLSRTNSLSLYCYFLFETLSTYIVVISFKNVRVSVSGISIPSIGCKGQSSYIARPQEDVDRL